MSIWDKFYRLDMLDIGFYDNTSAQKATIYANGKNQVEFYITVKIVDKNNNPIDIPDNELIKNIYLVRHIDGDTKLGTWSATSKKNDYAKVVAWDIQPNDAQVELYAGEKTIKYYLSSSEANSSIDVGVGIYVPGVGDFNTSQNGTNTRNGPKGEIGTPFKNPKSKHVNSIQPVDYSKSDEIEIKNMPTEMNDFETIVSDMAILAGWGDLVHIGISSKVKFTIHPKRSGYQFHLANPQRNNANLSTCNFPVKPDMVRNVGGDNFDVQFVFVNQQEYGVKPGSKFTFFNDKAGDCDYLFGSNDNRHNWNEKLDYGCITINICNHRTPWSNSRAAGWGDEGRVIKIDVTDNYGNSGVITIQSVLDENERWPGLFVNKK